MCLGATHPEHGIEANFIGRETQSAATGITVANVDGLVVQEHSSNTTNRTYDALNHVLTSTRTTANDATSAYSSASTAYGWGVDEHPLLVGGAQVNSNGVQPPPVQSSDTLHWDGGQPLFETTSSGQVDQIFIGTSGAILPLDSGYAGLTWFDRGPDGTIATCRNATGSAGARASNYGLSSSVTFGCYGGTGSVKMPTFAIAGTTTVPMVGSGGVITMPRTDGISDSVNVIQGVRTYDPNVGAWATPDTYQGEVHDPASQKSYMWNGNNPISYSDPSGYLFGSAADYDSLGGMSGGSGKPCGDACGVNNSSTGAGGAKDPPNAQVASTGSPAADNVPAGVVVTGSQPDPMSDTMTDYTLQVVNKKGQPVRQELWLQEHVKSLNGEHPVVQEKRLGSYDGSFTDEVGWPGGGSIKGTRIMNSLQTFTVTDSNGRTYNLSTVLHHAAKLKDGVMIYNYDRVVKP